MGKGCPVDGMSGLAETQLRLWPLSALRRVGDGAVNVHRPWAALQAMVVTDHTSTTLRNLPQ